MQTTKLTNVQAVLLLVAIGLILVFACVGVYVLGSHLLGVEVLVRETR